MATAKNIKKGLCDEVFRGLSDMKEKVVAMRKDIARINGVEPTVSELFDRHLGELVDQVDWKLQILSHACPYDWTGSAEYEENTVSVGPTDKSWPTFPADISAGKASECQGEAGGDVSDGLFFLLFRPAGPTAQNSSCFFNTILYYAPRLFNIAAGFD